MSLDQLTQLVVQVEAAEEDAEVVDAITRQLHDEIQDLDIESAELIKLGSVPQGAKPVDPVVLGALAVTVGPLVLTKVLDFLHAWAMRREDRNVKIKIQSADKSLEVEVPTTMSPDETKAWINALKGTLISSKK